MWGWPSRSLPANVKFACAPSPCSGGSQAATRATRRLKSARLALSSRMSVRHACSTWTLDYLSNLEINSSTKHLLSLCRKILPTGISGPIQSTGRSTRLSYLTKMSKFKMLSERWPRNLVQVQGETCLKSALSMSVDFVPGESCARIVMRKSQMRILTLWRREWMLTRESENAFMVSTIRLPKRSLTESRKLTYLRSQRTPTLQPCSSVMWTLQLTPPRPRPLSDRNLVSSEK